MSLPLDAVSEAVPREWARFRSLVSSTDGSTWSAPTRLAGWTVRDLAAHAVWGISMEADALRRRRTEAAGRAEGRTVGEEAGPQAILDELDGARHVLAAEVAELTEGDLETLAPLPYGDVPVGLFSQILVMEAGIHTSDLAAALGQDDALAPDVVVATEVFVRTFLPVVAGSASDTPASDLAVSLRGPTVALTFRHRDGSWHVPDPGEPVDPAVTVHGDDSTVLLFALGRVPDTHPGLTFSGDRGLASRIKAWLPGP